jgi:mRNA interferase MazF
MVSSSVKNTKPLVSRPAPPKVRASKVWVPDRQHVIWIDCNPQAGGEMRDFHPMLVLSPSAFNSRTGLVIGLPMTTAAYNATNPFALAVGAVGGSKPVGTIKSSKTSYVLCHQPKSFDWRARGAKPHLLGRLADAAFVSACALLNQIIDIE